jgi:type I restriction enzyme S subunit
VSEDPKPIPRGWARASLRAALLPTTTVDPRKFPSDEFFYVDIQAIDNLRQRIVKPKLLGTANAPSRARNLLSPGDVLFSLVRPYLKNIAIVPAELNASVASTAFYVCRPGSGMDSRYLLNFLRTQSFIASITTYGNSPPAARDEEFEHLPILIAPSAEQIRIADALDELLSDLDAGVAALEQARAKLALYRSAVLKAAVEGALTSEWRQQHPNVESATELLDSILAERRRHWEDEQTRKFTEKGQEPPKDWRARYREPAFNASDLAPLPRRWCWATAEQLAILVTDGDHNPPKRVEKGVAHLTAKHVKNMSLDPEGCTFISREDAARVFRRYRPEKGDLIITCVGSVGRTAIVPDGLEFSPDRDLAALRFSGAGPSTMYIQHFLEAPNIQAALISASGSTAQPHLYLGDLRSLPVALPPAAEQEVIVETVEDQLSVIEHLEADLQTKLKSAQALRQSILCQAFAGRLVPQDPTDEPAPDLLQRIAAAREARAREATIAKRTRINAIQPKKKTAKVP